MPTTATAIPTFVLLALAAWGCDKPTPRPAWCFESRFEGTVASGIPNRPLWVDDLAFHVAHNDPELGIVHRTLSRETGAQVALDSYQIYPKDLNPNTSATGLHAVAASPAGDLAFAYNYMSNYTVYYNGILSVSNGKTNVWTPPWMPRFDSVWGLGWDADGFTASLLDWDAIWAWARFSAQGEMLSQVEVVGPASVVYGEYDSETDKETGTTVFVGASSQGIAMVGRLGRQSSLTAPADHWNITAVDGDTKTSGVLPAVALQGGTALVAWISDDLSMREVSLKTGKLGKLWQVKMATIPGASVGDGIVEDIAAARAADRWVVVVRDYRGLVLIEVRDDEVKSRRILRHIPEPCVRNDSCNWNHTDDRWEAVKLSVVTNGDLAWAGIVDESTNRVEGNRTLWAYRILPLREGCDYESVGSK